MNDYLYLFHAVCVIAFLYGALFLGKSALITFVTLCSLFANFFVLKEIVLFGLESTASEVYTIGVMGGTLLLQEHWGREVAKKAAYISFFLLIFAGVSSFLHLQYLPSAHDVTDSNYRAILQPAPRLVGASLLTFFLVQIWERAVFAFLQKWPKLPFPLRAFCTTSLSIVVDSALFSLLGLYGIVHSLFDIFLISCLVKLVAATLSLPFLTFSQYFMKKREYEI